MILLLVAIAAVVVLAILIYRWERSKKLRQQFGPEYSRTVQETGSKARAEAKLGQLKKRVERFHIRPLTPGDRTRFADSWRAVQARFVDDPKGAVTQADALINEVMTVRGYPVSTFEQCAQDLSVDHPLVVEQYRAGHAISVRHAEGRASTEDLRQAMIHYRNLFDELARDSEAAVRRAG